MKTELKFSNTEDFGLLLKYCGVEYCEPKFMMHLHRREDFLIHYVFHGNGFFRCRDKEYPLSVGSVFAIFPKEVTSYGANPENPLNFCWIGFSGKNATRLVEIMGFSMKDPVLILDPHNDILKLVTRCVQLCKSPVSPVTYTDLEIQSILYNIFDTIRRKQGYSQINTNSSHMSSSLKNYISKTKSFIQLNFTKPLTIKEVANEICLDRTYLSKIFHHIEGITLHDYLTCLRMESAKRMLMETNCNIKEIGELVGIPDNYYFSRLFKRYTSLSPLQYRRDRQPEIKESPIITIGTTDELHFSNNNQLLP